MHRTFSRAIALALALLLTGSVAASAEDGADASLSPENLLRRMSDTLKNAETLRFHAEINFDDVLISGQKLQFSGAADVTVRRPDGVYIDYRDDLNAKRFWYDGKTGTLLDTVDAMYSTASLPASIDAAVDQLKDRYDLRLPLGELISSDLFEHIDARARGWGYIGVNDVEGTPAHHIAVLGDGVDLQVWIQRDGSPLPLKLVVTYKDVPQAPQYQAVLMDWKTDARVSAKTFEPELPDGAQEIEFLVAEKGR